MARISVKKAKNIKGKELQTVYGLTIRGKNVSSALRWRFREARKLDCSNFDVILAKEKDKIVGWGLLEHNYTWGGTCIRMYVNRKYRRKGIGAKIVKKAKDLSEKIPYVYMWTKEAKGFFESQGFDQNRDHWFGELKR